jgi:3-oxo-5-alpha-steroid 4-dehydrogenase 1
MLLFLSLSYKQFEYFQFAWIAVAVFVFFLLLKITAPYGRHTKKGWGPLISNKWGWLLMELPVLAVLGIFILPTINTVAVASWIMIGLFSLHYFNRVFVFPFRIHTKGKKMPLIIMLSAIFFNIMNGFSFGYYFSHFAAYSNGWLTDIRFIVGTILFFTGIYINWKADNILIHLRKPGETHYIIPQGWLFEKISCPNLFGELIEWLGFAILCWSLPGITFFIWTAANLIPRALSHHNWYKEKFIDYPADRKAVLPFVV